MANKGPNTNGSQFYILFAKSAEHLDGVNAVFGRVIGGLETLDEMEKVTVDKKGRPVDGLQSVMIESVTVHANPLAG